jgi:hypothetical protein
MHACKAARPETMRSGRRGAWDVSLFDCVLQCWNHNAHMTPGRCPLYAQAQPPACLVQMPNAATPLAQFHFLLVGCRAPWYTARLLVDSEGGCDAGSHPRELLSAGRLLNYAWGFQARGFSPSLYDSQLKRRAAAEVPP